MKTIKYFLSILAVSALLASCIGDLNVTPIDPNANTADKALVNEASFTSFLAGVYTGFATSGYYGANGGPSISGLDGGASQYIRGLFHHSELTTDEAVCGWNDQTIKNFHWMNWTTDDTFIYAFYSRIFMQVSAANEFIREAQASNLTFANKDEYIAEARVLRAIAYFHAIDNFGNVPFADETSVVGSFPEQIMRDELFTWLETELTDLINNSALAAPRANGFARADKGVAKFLLAKLYLNAQVYTGTARWNECANVLKDLMDDGYSLHTTSEGLFSPYQELFLADNDRCSDEIIFAVEQDGVNTTSYGATNYLIFASTGGEMDPAELGISSGWGGLRTTPEFYDKFSASDARNLFYTATQQKSIDDIGEFTNGYAFMKFRNIKSDGTPGKELGFVDTDFPMMRYADVLLMAAECQLNGASIDGLGAFNQVRARANQPDVNGLTAQLILDERGRELYQECWRRNDLIRFGQFTSGYNWQWKGNVKEGTDVESYRTLFPIPDSDRLANTGLKQNTGYSK
ncbi:MAG: RagB/SusD family nutrient uptake outer membrane protein [Bacteroidales bacterium]|nr:RagB/SusD family nutrient uptake outer membrane protein [Bacteroidales bacterium]